MPLTVLVNAQPTRIGARWSITKDGSQERGRFALFDPVESALAVRWSEDDVVEVYHGADLVLGGVPGELGDARIGGETGVDSGALIVDWMHLADEVFVPMQTFASQSGLELFAALIALLANKGVTNISAPTGGPAVPELSVEDDTTTLRTVLDRLAEQMRWPWRINGAKQAAMVEPGSLPGPVVLSGANATFRDDVRWTRARFRKATRLSARTEEPVAGPGPYEYSESYTADGLRTVFPVHVLPTNIPCNAAAAAAAAATSLSLKGLPESAYLRIGAQFALEGHVALYVTQGSVTTDAAGLATVTIDPPLERAVDAGASLVARRGSFVQLELDGVATALAGAPWVWDPIENALVKPDAAVTAGVVVTYRTWLRHPTTVRAWAADALTTVGAFDTSVLYDGKLEEAEHTDAAACLAFLVGALERRESTPQIVELTTRTKGWYPYLVAMLDFPERQLEGLFVVERVALRPTGIAPESTDEDVWYDLTLREGIEAGRTAIDFQRYKAGLMAGVRWGVTPPVETLEWTTARQLTAPSAATGVSVTPSATAGANSAFVEVIASTPEAWVLTGVCVETPGATGVFAVDVAVGAAASEVVIATLQGRHQSVTLNELQYMALSIPIDAIPSGSRVSIRMRKEGTSVVPWVYSLTALAKPITGTLLTTTKPTKVSTVATVPTVAAAWTFGAYVELIASAPADLILTALTIANPIYSTIQWEVEIAVGAASSEALITTIRGYNSTDATGGPCYYSLPTPLSAIPAGSRVSARFRVDRSAGTAGARIGLQYHEAPL